MASKPYWDSWLGCSSFPVSKGTGLCAPGGLRGAKGADCGESLHARSLAMRAEGSLCVCEPLMGWDRAGGGKRKELDHRPRPGSLMLSCSSMKPKESENSKF